LIFCLKAHRPDDTAPGWQFDIDAAQLLPYFGQSRSELHGLRDRCNEESADFGLGAATALGSSKLERPEGFVWQVPDHYGSHGV
jgi:hypothetical protein